MFIEGFDFLRNVAEGGRGDGMLLERSRPGDLVLCNSHVMPTCVHSFLQTLPECMRVLCAGYVCKHLTDSTALFPVGCPS